MALRVVLLLVLLGALVADGLCDNLPDVGKDMADIVSEKGYPIEEHRVITADGYNLGMFRIPFGQAGPGTQPRPPVLLNHGLLDSSYTWVNNFPSESLGFLLADAGYDVWLSNNRGNTYSTPTPSPPDSFWQFTWDDMAKYDLPANIDYILNATGATTVSYVGHSQGTTQAFAGFSEDGVLQSKVNFFGALAPVAYVDHQKSVLLQILADLDAAVFFEILGVRDFLPSSSIIDKLAPGLCELVPWGCDDFLFLIVGPSKNLNSTRVPVYVSETPAGTSVMNMAHWIQGVKTDAFQKYDYGCGLFSCENEKHYGQKTPPKYDLSQVKLPTALYYGNEDDLADTTDVDKLLKLLPPSTIVEATEIQGFAHLDFTWGKDANKKVYSNLIAHIAKYSAGAFSD